MGDLVSLAITWIAVFVTHYAAAKTNFTPALWFLAMGCLRAMHFWGIATAP